MFHEAGLVCAFFACAGFLWANVDPCWKKTSGDLNVQPYDICYGLYKSCTITSVEEWLCDGNFSETPLDLNVSARVHYCKSALITAVILTSAGILLGGFGAECCTAGKLDARNKGKYRTWAGWFFLLSALMPAACAAWTTHAILQERYWYRYTNTPGLQFTINRGVYITFGASLLDVVACICFTLLSDNGCFNTGTKDEDGTNGRYIPPISKERKPTRKSNAVEYV